MARRSKSSARSLNGHFTDPLVPREHAQGRRSRAVFKLEKPDPREKLPDPGVICLDFCRRARGGSVQGDFREREVLAHPAGAAAAAGRSRALGRGSPVARHRCRRSAAADAPGRAGARYGGRVLKRRRDALIKVLRGCESQELVQGGRGRFAKVKLIEPVASS